jgi:FdhE protein
VTATPPAETWSLPDDIVPVRLPDPARLFAARAARCRALAPGHAVAGYLELLGAIADAQDAACGEMPLSPIGHSLLWPVPLAADTCPRTEGWRRALDRIVGGVSSVPVPAETTAALARLRGMSVVEREQIAAAVLELPGAADADPAVSVFVAAALQVHWSTLAALVPRGTASPDLGGRCPVCGSAPVAGTILGDRPLRYLTCSLCATAWHLTRLVCSHCGSTADLSYFAIDGAAPAVKAEACGRCDRYLKLFYLERIPGADAVADDVATLALDLRMADEGFSRVGVNLFVSAGGPKGHALHTDLP